MTETRCEFSHVFGSEVRELEVTVVVVESSMVEEMEILDTGRDRGLRGGTHASVR